MTKINLLPPEYRRKSVDRIKKRREVSVVLFLICFSVYCMFVFSYLTSEWRLKEVKQELLKLQPLATRYEVTRQQLDQVELQLNQFKQKQQRQCHWDALLLSINERLPVDVWLTRFIAREDGSLLIKGTSNSLNSISVFLNQLSQMPQLEQVQLKNATREGQKNLIGYEIGAYIKGGSVSNAY
jgi:Tfp pilus assembly protein PilN